MKPYENDEQLAAELRGLKPTPRPEFAAELDERAAAGFPRRSRLHWPSFSMPRWSFRRFLLPAGGLAVMAIAIATAFVSTNETTESQPVRPLALTNPTEKPADTAAAPEPIERASKDEHLAQGGSSSAGQGSSGVQYEAAVPSAAERATFEASAEAPSYGAANTDLQPFSSRQRAVERSAQIVLAAEPGDVAEDSRKVFEAVHAHDGIVMRSSTREGKAGAAGARFELLIPSTKLGDALAALSDVDEVRSRHEATTDITAPTVNVGELLQDSKARIDSLLGQLEAAESESEREVVEAELRQERRHRARLRAQLQHLQKRADLARVSLRIETGAAEDSSGGGAWGIDDALGDAGRILGVAAAVTLVALAVIAPIALIALLAWIAHRAWVRRERRRVLS